MQFVFYFYSINLLLFSQNAPSLAFADEIMCDFNLFARLPLSEINFNLLDGRVDRRSYEGDYQLDSNGRPLNPRGRTGLVGRGLLGRWGPNHAADPIVTR